jgi:replicative DNA helicase
MIRLDGSDKSGDWISWKDAFKQENERRLNTKADDLCGYGIKPLDDSLFRIAQNELVVIGADSGMGKSELGLNIARYNAKKGKVGAVFYLEGGHFEAMARIK